MSLVLVTFITMQAHFNIPQDFPVSTQLGDCEWTSEGFVALCDARFETPYGLKEIHE